MPTRRVFLAACLAGCTRGQSSVRLRCEAGQNRGRRLQTRRQSDEPASGGAIRFSIFRRGRSDPAPFLYCTAPPAASNRASAVARARRRIWLPAAFAGFAGSHLGRDPLWLRRRYAPDRPGCQGICGPPGGRAQDRGLRILGRRVLRAGSRHVEWRSVQRRNGIFPGIHSFRQRKNGTPRISISHGTKDQILPFEGSSQRLVPQLEQAGYSVKFQEFDGPHGVPPEIARQAIEWFLK